MAIVLTYYDGMEKFGIWINNTCPVRRFTRLLPRENFLTSLILLISNTTVFHDSISPNVTVKNSRINS